MRDQQNPVRRPVHNNGGAYMFNSHQTNQHQSGWGVGQVQSVAMQQQHFPLLQQQQQQQQQRRSQYHQHQTQWGTLINSGTTLPLIGQQQHQQQLQQPQQQLQPWGGQYAQTRSQQQQHLPLQVTQFNPSVIQPQPHIVQVQSNHQSTPRGHQHNLQSIHPSNPSQPHPTPQSWTPHLPTARGLPLVGCANGALSMPWGQQPRGRGISPAAKRSAPTVGSSWSPKTGSISSSSSSFNGTGTPGEGVASSHRDSFSLGTPPSPSRHDGVSNKRARKRKSRATGTVTPANKCAPSSGNGVASRGSAVAVKEGKGMSVSFDENDSQDNGGGVPRVQPCEPCEKEFNSESARKAHLESHVTCKEKGCEFSALPKVVNYHHEIKHGQFSGSGFQMIDVEGQKFRVLLGTCPEEVEQWRAARRKLWPTNANIVRKNEQMKKRKQLGDLGPDTGFAGRGRGRGRGRRRGGSMRGVPPILECAATDDTQKNGENVVGGLEKGTPAKMESLSEGVVPEMESGVEVDEGLEGGEESRKMKKRLCSFYLRGKCTKGDACTFSHDVERRPCGYFMKGKCFRGKACTFIHDIEARAKAKRESRDAADGSSEKPDKKRAAKRLKAERDVMRQVESKPTLLRNLLAPQLHRESSIALQAVRFIVESNFFLDPGPAKADRETSNSSPSDAATATPATDTADVCDAVSSSSDRLPSESQTREEDEEPHKTVVTKAAESAVAAVTATIGFVADADSETVISGAAPSATGTSVNGLPPEDKNRDAAGSIQSRVLEGGLHQVVERECVGSAVVPMVVDVVVAECAKDTHDSAAVTATGTNGVLLGDQCGDLAGNTQSRVGEDELQTVKTERGGRAMVSGVGNLEEMDISTGGSTAPASAVASATKVAGVSPEYQGSNAASTRKNCIEGKNPQPAVENESVVSSVVRSMTGEDLAMDSRDIVAVSTSTDGVLPEEKRDAFYSSPKRYAEDMKPHQAAEDESLVHATAPRVAGVMAGADIATDSQSAVVAASDGLSQGKNEDVDAACGSQNRVEEENENKTVGMQSPATAGSCDAPAAAAISSIDVPPLTSAQVLSKT